MENLEQPFKKKENNLFNLETIFRFCPDGIVYKDQMLRYIDANESYIKTFSSNNFNSIIGKKINPFINKNIMKLIQDADSQVVENCQPINYVINLNDDTLLNITTFPIINNNHF